MNEERRSAQVLVRQALDPENLPKLKADPEGTLRELEARILQHPRAPLSKIKSYIALSLLELQFMFVQGHGEVKKFPHVLTAVGSASLGALAGILSPQRS